MGTCAVGDCEGNGVKMFREDAPLPRAWHLCAEHLAKLEAQPDWPKRGAAQEELAAFFRWLPTQRPTP